MPKPDPATASVSSSPPGDGQRRWEKMLPPAVTELLEKAVQNERILLRYQAFELELLSLDGLEALLDALLEQSVSYFKLDAIELWLLDASGALRSLLPTDAEQRWPGLRWLASDTEMAALYTRPPAVRLCPCTPAAAPEVLRGRAIGSVALLPLVRRGELVGSLHFGAFSEQRFSADKSTEFINHLACIIAMCLESSINQEQLRRLSLVDMLTGVANRRAFHQALEREIARARRASEPLAMLFADLDHFKRINDAHGHLTGDQVLREVAAAIATMLRSTDHVCRYGGEEFALILPNCSQTLALDVADRIRRRVEELRLRNSQGQPVAVSLSIGVSHWQGGEKAPEQLDQCLVASADAALYQAKHAGRNRVSYGALQAR